MTGLGATFGLSNYGLIAIYILKFSDNFIEVHCVFKKLQYRTQIRFQFQKCASISMYHVIKKIIKINGLVNFAALPQI